MQRVVTPDHQAIYTLPSRSQDRPRHPVINLDDGSVRCDCPDWEMRRTKQADADGVVPTIADIKYQCHHLKIAVADCIKRGDITLRLRQL